MSNPYANPYASNYGASANRYGDPYNASASASTTSIEGSTNPYAASSTSLASTNRDRRAGGWGGLGESTTSLRSGRGTPGVSDEHENKDASISPLRSREDLRSRTPRAYGANSDRPGAPSESRSRNGYDRGADTDRRRRPGERPRDFSESSQSRDRVKRYNGINGDSGQRNDYGYDGGFSRPERSRPKDMEEVLQYIKSNWSFMGGEDCVPVQVALQLMDPSTLGLANREPEFQQTQIDLQKSLKKIVNEHHQDFNSSIGTYHKIQNSIQNSQQRVRILKNSLQDAKGGLLTTKPELKELATSSQAFDDMIGLFGQIEGIQAFPERLEGSISEKRFLTAVDVLQEALRLVRRSELDGIGGISDLRTYFSNQEASLTDILVEELHDHLYLKSPYCQDRWKALSPDRDKNSPDTMQLNGTNAWDRPVYQYISSLDVSTQMAEDSSRNPEADTFYYIHMTLESLSRLGQLEIAVNRIDQRMPVELFGVVERTNQEIDAKHPSITRGHMKKEKRRLTLPSETNDGRLTVLSDLLWTLYAKFEAIAEGHRVLHDVVSGIATREKLQNPGRYTGGFKELWKLFQSEMRSLLHDYLATDGDMTLRAGVTFAEGANVFSKNLRDRNKRMFKLSEMDQKSAEMKNEQDDLDEILKASVPGLISKTRASYAAARDSTHPGQQSTAAGHKLLIEPSVFNMTVLLPPSLSFLQHLKDIVPVNSDIAMSTLTSFLDDFLVNVFHPQLEEAVTELCTQSIIDLEAFTEDPQWSTVSPRPIFKGTRIFFNIVHTFSRMLTAIPQDSLFTQLIISQVVTYYDKCFGWYKTLMSRLINTNTSGITSPGPVTSNVTLKTAAAFAESGNIRDAALSLWETFVSPSASSTRSSLVKQETNNLLSQTTSTPLSSYDMMSDSKSAHYLSLLYNSTSWLCSSLMRLRHVSQTAAASRSRPSSHNGPSDSHNRSSSHSRRWTLLSTLSKPGSMSANGTRTTGAIGNSLRISQVYLPLTSETAASFDTTLQSLRSLALTALLTLHVDIRCGIIFMLGRTLRSPATPNHPASGTHISGTGEGNRDSSQINEQPPLDSYPFVLPTPPQSASSGVLELNIELLTFSNTLSMYLGDRERDFITTGLGPLVDEVMVRDAGMIGCVNRNGAERIGLDLLVLQQNLRGLGASSHSSKQSHVRSGSGSSSGLGIAPPLSTEENASGGDVTLSRATKYYSLFLAGPAAILEYAKAMKGAREGDGSAVVVFSYGELKILNDLCHSEGMRSGEREVVVRAKKSMRDVGVGLDEVLWDS